MRSFSPHVMARVLDILLEGGPMKKTALAGKTRMNYLVLKKYVDFLTALSWVHSVNSNGSSDVYITQSGIRFRRLISDYLNNSIQAIPSMSKKPLTGLSMKSQ